MRRATSKALLACLSIVLPLSALADAPKRRIVLPTIELHCSNPAAIKERELQVLKETTMQTIAQPEIGLFEGDFSRIDKVVRKAVAADATFTSCMNRLVDQTCKQSPWPEKSIPERAIALNRIAKATHTPYANHGLNSERLIPCLAMRESVIEPASTYEGNCYGAQVNSRGLFHVELETLEDLTGPQFDFAAQNYPRGKMNRSQYARFLHKEMESDIKLQIEIMHATFKRKQAIYDWEYRKNHKNKPPAHEASLRELLERYNGSSQKRAYADAVIQCMACIKQSKEITGACLAKAHPNDALILTKWDRCKRQTETLATAVGENR